MKFRFVAEIVFTAEQKIQIIEFWYETKLYIMVRRRFCREFNVNIRDAPKIILYRGVLNTLRVRVQSIIQTRAIVDGQKWSQDPSKH